MLLILLPILPPHVIQLLMPAVLKAQTFPRAEIFPVERFHSRIPPPLLYAPGHSLRNAHRVPHCFGYPHRADCPSEARQAPSQAFRKFSNGPCPCPCLPLPLCGAVI